MYGTNFLQHKANWTPTNLCDTISFRSLDFVPQKIFVPSENSYDRFQVIHGKFCFFVLQYPFLGTMGASIGPLGNWALKKICFFSAEHVVSQSTPSTRN